MSSKNIVYNKAYYKLTGSLSGAVLLSHMCYLYSEVFGGKEFFQTDDQIYETLGFSERTLRTAKSHTKKYLTARKVGAPAKNHWTVDVDALTDGLVSLQCVKASSVETVMTGSVETVMTRHVETVTCKKKELKKKELKKKELIYDHKEKPKSKTAPLKTKDRIKKFNAEEVHVFESLTELGMYKPLAAQHVEKHALSKIYDVMQMSRDPEVKNKGAYITTSLACG